jgi:FlaA1/EpsC-like NDP-sugar epimerase
MGKIKRFWREVSPMHYLGRNFVSRWVILFFDMILVSLSLFLAYFLQSKVSVFEFSFNPFFNSLLSVLAFMLIGHYVFKPHTGIIRHTSLYDVRRVFLARSLSFVLNLLFISVFAEPIGLVQYASPWLVSVLTYIISIYILVQFRLIVKYIFNLGKKSKSKPRIIIYGAGEAGHFAYDALSSSNHVVAFIDDNYKKKGKTFKGVPIVYSGSNILDLIKKGDVGQVVIALQNCTASEKRMIVNRCMDWDLEVKTVPPIDNWINGELTNSQIKVVNIEDLLGREVIKLGNAHLRSNMSGKTILVTGAAGSIGSEIARQLVYCNPKVIILLDQAESPLYHLELELSHKCSLQNITLKVLLGDVSDVRSMERIFKTDAIDMVFHAAAYKHVPAMELNPIQSVKVNILGTKCIADLCDKYGVSKMVFISTDKAVNPTNVMGACKRAAELYIQSKNKLSSTSYITTRFGNVLGSNGSVIPLFKRQIALGGPVTVTHPDITRYFMTIPEACQLVLEAGLIGNGGEILVFDMGESMKIMDLAMKMIRLSGFVPNKDIRIEITGLRPGEKLYEELLNNAEEVMPTHHEKIMIAKVAENSYEVVLVSIQQLEKMVADQASDNDLVGCLKSLIPEYVSQNSHFQALD